MCLLAPWAILGGKYRDRNNLLRTTVKCKNRSPTPIELTFQNRTDSLNKTTECRSPHEESHRSHVIRVLPGQPGKAQPEPGLEVRRCQSHCGSGPRYLSGGAVWISQSEHQGTQYKIHTEKHVSNITLFIERPRTHKSLRVCWRKTGCLGQVFFFPT